MSRIRQLEQSTAGPVLVPLQIDATRRLHHAVLNTDSAAQALNTVALVVSLAVHSRLHLVRVLSLAAEPLPLPNLLPSLALVPLVTNAPRQQNAARLSDTAVIHMNTVALDAVPMDPTNPAAVSQK